MRTNCWKRTVCAALAMILALSMLCVPLPAKADMPSITLYGQTYTGGEEFGGDPNHDCDFYGNSDLEELWDCDVGGVLFHVCSVCGKKKVFGIMNPTAHKYEFPVITPATDTTDGVATFTCVKCHHESVTVPIRHGESYQVTLPEGIVGSGVVLYGQFYMLELEIGGDPNHDCFWSYENCDREDIWDCPVGGVGLYICRTCGKRWVGSIHMPTEHRYEKADSVVDVERNVRIWTCSLCGNQYEENLPERDNTPLSKSGDLNMNKMTKEEIKQLLRDYPMDTPEQVYLANPSPVVPYALGTVSPAALNAAVRRLTGLRRLAGLPAVQLDSSLTELCQYAAVTMAANDDLDHYPDRPAGMSDDFYSKACEAARRSNIAAGYPVTTAMDGFMDDSDASNVSVCGHRAWQLNPTMGKTGIGSCGRYLVEYSFDTSGTAPDYDFVSWPASGNFPSNLIAFGKDTAWSVSLNPKKYRTPDSDVTVTLTRELDGRTWSFQGEGYKAADSGLYFNVSNYGAGDANAVIFRPDGIEKYAGIYTVNIQGLKDKDGFPITISYQVDFFDADPKPTFSDVPASHWSFESVQRATDLGLLNGTGGGKFSPDKTMTYAEFAAMLTRAFYHNDVAAQGTGGQWYTPNINVAQAKGLLNGTRYASAGPNTIIDRYDMAMMIYNLQAQLGQLPSQAQISAAQGSIKDWSTVPAAYQQAVAASYATGMITGTGTGNFDGSKTMTRAEAATVLVRLLG